MLTAGTLLEGAPLEVLVDEQEFVCPCGHRQIVTSDDLIGHLFVCPACGVAEELHNTHDFSVIEVVAEVDDEEPALAGAATAGESG